MDVLAKAELTLPVIAAGIRDSGFEYADFKLTFSLSMRAYLNRYLVITQVEQGLGSGKSFTGYFNKASYRGGHDFKEVFKWIMSPLIAREINVQANLEGSFLVNCAFS